MPPLQPGMNPATWMLEITAFASEERLGVDFAEIWAQSGLARSAFSIFWTTWTDLVIAIGWLKLPQLNVCQCQADIL